MTKCPHCHKELPPMDLNSEDFHYIMEQLKKNKKFMYELGQQAAEEYFNGMSRMP